MYRKRNYPIFDYEEIDDVEFENLLLQSNSTFSQPKRTIWSNLANLFRYPNQYQPVSTFDDLRNEDTRAAELLTSQQINDLNTRVQESQKPSSMYGKSVEFDIFEKNMQESKMISDPLQVYPSLVEQRVEQSMNDTIQDSGQVEPIVESPKVEQFDPKILGLLTGKDYENKS